MSSSTTCGGCGKAEAEAGKPLKHCAKCQTTQYCSRECQKQDWKQHKKVCAANAGTRTGTTTTDAPSTAGRNSSSQSTTSRPKNLDIFIEKPFTKLHARIWLHDRSERDTFKLLIDAYRLRVEDNRNFSGESNAASSEAGFRQFLRLTETRGSLLPSWWTTEKTNECLRFGSTDTTHTLQHAVKKSDVERYYGVQDMPMQLRMFGEQAYGSGPGGQDGTNMLRAKMAVEGGGLFEEQIDMSRSMFR